MILGKTTLADSLIASNGIISQRHAGKVSYSPRLQSSCSLCHRFVIWTVVTTSRPAGLP